MEIFHDTSNINFKELPHISQEIAWNENGAQVCVKSLSQRFPEICSDGADGAIITWHDNINYLTTGWDIYAQHIDSNGILQMEVTGTVICTAEDTQLYPQIISDGAGGAIITWEDRRNGATSDIYAQRIDSNGIVQWNANGKVICNAITDQRDPRICSDGAGGAIITWYDYRSGSNNDIYAQHIDSSGTVLWTSNGEAICTEVDHQENPQICSDGAGGAIIAWEDQRNGDEDIYTQHIDSDGVVQWEDNGKVICTASNVQEILQICSDGVGGAFIGWEDERSGNKDIYAQHVNLNGAMQWMNNGKAICTASNDQVYLQICSDGAGGVITTWKDLRSGTHNDIYAQHVNLSGTIQWMNNGKAICTADEGQSNPQVCSDGTGGAIITWQDYRSGSKNDIYAQRIDLNGDLKWMFNGIPICMADGSRSRPLITTDGAGTAIIVWEDNRNDLTTGIDLYAQKLENPPPTSNHPLDIITSLGGSETINWTLFDDFGSGNYRVLANNTLGNNYVWVDWTSWVNNTALNVPINRTNPGYFDYSIEYYDDQHNFGVSDTVIVQILEPEGGINGYSLIILLSCTLGVILILTKKLKQSRNV